MSDKQVKVFGEMMDFFERSTLALPQADGIEPAVPLPTNLTSFDRMSEIGGWPRGKLSEISGWEGTFKTGLTLHSIAQANAAGERAQFYNVEGATDWRRMQGFGVSPELTVCPQFFSAEDIWRHLLYAVAMGCEHGMYGMIVVDSIAVIRPAALQDREQLHLKMNENVDLAKVMTQLTDDLQAGFKVKPFPVSSGKRIIMRPPPHVSMDQTYRLGDSNIAMIFINHLKEKPGITYGNSNYTPGGRGKDWNYDFRLEAYRAALSDADKKDKSLIDGQGRPLKVALRIKNTKNRCGLMGGVARLNFWTAESRFESGALTDLVAVGVRLGLIEKKGAWYYCSDFPEERIQGLQAVSDFLNGDGQFLRDEIIRLDQEDAEAAIKASPDQTHPEKAPVDNVIDLGDNTSTSTNKQPVMRKHGSLFKKRGKPKVTIEGI